MDGSQFIAIHPNDVNQKLSKEEIVYLFKELGGYWEYDYGALESGKPGYHAELKSGLCSDVFIDSKAVLQYENLRRIIAKQLADKYENSDRSQYNLDWSSPTCVAGIPKGAKLLGGNVADIFGARVIDLVKQDGNIKMNSALELHDTLLFVEDICTKGTALIESVNAVMKKNYSGRILPFVLTIVNRGELDKIRTDSGFVFSIISLCSIKANEWDESDCELCRCGSIRIKPKEKPENWRLIMASQL